MTENEVITTEATEKPKRKRAPKAPVKKTISKKANSKKSDEDGRKGRKSAYAGCKLVRVTTANPFRAGTNVAATFDLIKGGIKYEDFRAQGGDRLHLANMINAGHVKLG